MGGQTGEVPRQPHGRTDPHLSAEGFDASAAAATLVAKASNETTKSPIRALANAILPKKTPKPEPSPQEDVVAAATADNVATVDVAEQGSAEAVAAAEEQAYVEPIPARMADIDPVKTPPCRSPGWVDPGRILAERSRRRAPS